MALRPRACLIRPASSKLIPAQLPFSRIPQRPLATHVPSWQSPTPSSPLAVNPSYGKRTFSSKSADIVKDLKEMTADLRREMNDRYPNPTHEQEQLMTDFEAVLIFMVRWAEIWTDVGWRPGEGVRLHGSYLMRRGLAADSKLRVLSLPERLFLTAICNVYEVTEEGQRPWRVILVLSACIFYWLYRVQERRKGMA